MFEKIKLGFGFTIGMFLGHMAIGAVSKLAETFNGDKEEDSNTEDETSI